MPKNEQSFSKAARKGEKRERIMRAAVKVFAKSGFYETRVSEIAKEAGVADGTIYLYFKNKDDVLVSVFTDRIERLIKVLNRELAQASDAVSGLERVIELQLGLLEGQRELAEVITVNLRQSSTLLRQYAAPLFTQYLGVIAEAIAKGQKEGVFRSDLNPKILARALYGALDGVLVTWALTNQSDAALRKAATQVSSLFIDGLRAR